MAVDYSSMGMVQSVSLLKSLSALSFFLAWSSFSSLCRFSSQTKLFLSLPTLFLAVFIAYQPSARKAAIASICSSSYFLSACYLTSISSMTDWMLCSLQQLEKQLRFCWQSLARSLSSLRLYQSCICFSFSRIRASTPSLLVDQIVVSLPAIFSYRVLHSSTIISIFRGKSTSKVVILSGSTSQISWSIFYYIWIYSQCILLLYYFSLRFSCVTFSRSNLRMPCFWFLLAMISVSRLTFSPTSCKLRQQSRMFWVAASSNYMRLVSDTIQLSWTATAVSSSPSNFSSSLLSVSSCSFRPTSTRMSSYNDRILARSLQISS